MYSFDTSVFMDWNAKPETGRSRMRERERPIAFVWSLRRAMPADFFREARVAVG
jgi:hypothetical protein